MRSAPEIQFAARKNKWLAECLKRFQFLLDNINNPAVVVTAINDREPLKNTITKSLKIEAGILKKVLEDIDKGTGDYVLNDESRVGAWLQGFGFKEQTLESIPRSRLLICESIVFSAVTSVNHSVTEFYISKLDKADSSIKKELVSDQLGFQDILVKEMSDHCQQYLEKIQLICDKNAIAIANKIIRIFEKGGIAWMNDAAPMFLPNVRKMANGKEGIIIDNVIDNARLVLNTHPEMGRMPDKTGLENLMSELSIFRDFMIVLNSPRPPLDRLVTFNLCFPSAVSLLRKYYGLDEKLTTKSRLWYKSADKNSKQKPDELVSVPKKK